MRSKWQLIFLIDSCDFFKDLNFNESVERKPLQLSGPLYQIFIGNNCSREYECVVNELLNNYRALCAHVLWKCIRSVHICTIFQKAVAISVKCEERVFRKTFEWLVVGTKVVGVWIYLQTTVDASREMLLMYIGTKYFRKFSCALVSFSFSNMKLIYPERTNFIHLLSTPVSYSYLLLYI